jgi:1,4-alpha-glucan branching enzyme
MKTATLQIKKSRSARTAQAAPKTRLMEFTCEAPGAATVFLAGSFNGWDPKAHAMSRTADGFWSTKVPLEAGRYEFKFVVDGRWCCKPGCDDSGGRDCSHCVPNDYGTMNRVLTVS